MSVKTHYCVNENIKADNVMLISSDGRKIGIIKRDEAIRMANDEGLDLLLVSNANNQEPPICKITDIGKIKYWDSKNKKHQVDVTKEIKFSFAISQRDLDIKHKKIIEFLEKKYRVVYTMELKGREKHMKDAAVAKFNSSVLSFSGLATWKPPSVSHNSVSTMLSPMGKN
jgi:translation initiation factor IF-3